VESNSKVARCIRCAIAEAIVAQELAEKIFRDFYVGDKETENELSDFRKVLTFLSKEYPKEATIIRCQLVKVCNEPSKVDALATQAAQEVCGALCYWLNDDSAQGQFVEGLRGIFVDAIGIWQHLQRTVQGAVVVMDLTPDSWIEETDTRPEYDSVTLRSEQNSPQQPVSELAGPQAVLFPQVWAGEELLFHGFALFSTQTAVIAARVERNSQQSLRKTITQRRRLSNMDRRPRMEQGIATRVLPDASDSVVPQQRQPLSATPAERELSFSGTMVNSQPQGRAGTTASVSSRGRRSERGSSGD
jgi:hypothetical protein